MTTDLTHTADLNDFIVVYAAQEFREARWAWWTFPNNGFIVRIELQDGSGAIETYTPRPHTAQMLLVDETVYLPLRNSLLAYDHRHDATFRTLTPFTRPGGVIVGEDFVVWSDEQNGRVYHLQ